MFDLRDLDCKFDSILIEPPLEEYQRTLGVTKDKYWSWEEVSMMIHISESLIAGFSLGVKTVSGLEF